MQLLQGFERRQVGGARLLGVLAGHLAASLTLLTLPAALDAGEEAGAELGLVAAAVKVGGHDDGFALALEPTQPCDGDLDIGVDYSERPTLFACDPERIQAHEDWRPAALLLEIGHHAERMGGHLRGPPNAEEPAVSAHECPRAEKHRSKTLSHDANTVRFGVREVDEAADFHCAKLGGFAVTVGISSGGNCRPARLSLVKGPPRCGRATPSCIGLGGHAAVPAEISDSTHADPNALSRRTTRGNSQPSASKCERS